MANAVCKYNGEEFSHGSDICQAGAVKRCIDGDWVDTGRECETESHDCRSLVQELSEEEELTLEAEFASSDAKYNGPSTDTSGIKKITAYAWSMYLRKGTKFYFWTGGKTPGAICSGPHLRYQVAIDDVSKIGNRVQCKSDPTRYHQKINFNWGV